MNDCPPPLIKGNRPSTAPFHRFFSQANFCNMTFAGMLLQIDWQVFLLGEDNWRFLLEVLLRTTVMFLGAYIAMRMMGRRAVIQGIFEIVLIICLGSAAGDAMFYSKVGVLPALLVLLTVVIEYSVLNYFMALWPRFERVMEGRIIPLIEDGVFKERVLKYGHFTLNEILADLRLANVSQLGQVSRVYIEANGHISLFYFPDEEVRYGLCILPGELDSTFSRIQIKDYYSCAYCGFTRIIEPGEYRCANCGNETCCRSSNEKRRK